MKISLSKISFTIALLGILILLFLANTLEPKQMNIKDITPNHLNKQVKIQGQITNLRTINPTFQILTLTDKTGQIQATINSNPQLKTNQEIVILGRITQYQNELQIQINKIILQAP